MPQLFPFDQCRLAAFELTENHVRITLVQTSSHAACPQCHQASSRIHSRYTRTVADLPWADYQVCFQLHVRRFFCPTTTCPQRIFAERCGPMLPRSARRTTRLTEHVRLLAFATTGQGAARLSHQMALPISPRTILRIQHATPDCPQAAPEQVGIDDWAWKKGRSYGSICVDLARRIPIDLLPDRDSASIARWFQERPTVQVVTRDRGPMYIDGITQGAPQAIQIADRWHLVKNLRETLETVLGQYPAALQQATQSARAVTSTPIARGRRVPPSQKSRPSARARAVHRRYQRRVTRLYHDIHGLLANQVPIARIARQLGINRSTVYHYARMTAPPAPRQIPPRRPSVIAAHKPYVIQRWNEGCRNATQMWRELRDQGHTATLRTITRYVEMLRRDSGRPHKFRSMPAAPIYALEPATSRPLSARQASYLCVRRASKRTPTQTTWYTRLCAADQALEQALRLCERFLVIVRERTGHDLDQWLDDATTSSFAPLKGFATGLQKDYTAVKAGLTMEWSNGQTESHVQRLKLLKRQMYGRASFALLRKRVLYRPPSMLQHPKAPSAAVQRA